MLNAPIRESIFKLYIITSPTMVTYVIALGSFYMVFQEVQHLEFSLDFFN